MREYNCIQPVDHDGKRYPIGSPITLDALTAAPLLEVRAIAEPAIAERALSEVLTGSDYLPALIRITRDITVPQTEVVQRAFVASGLDYAGWNGLTDDDRELRIASSLELVREQYRDPLLTTGGVGIAMAKAEGERVERENLADDPQVPAAVDVVIEHGAVATGDGATVIEGTATTASGEAVATTAVAIDPVAATHTHTPQDGKNKRRT